MNAQFEVMMLFYKKSLYSLIKYFIILRLAKFIRNNIRVKKPAVLVQNSSFHKAAMREEICAEISNHHITINF
jgi:hypothetical protein